MCVDWSKNVNCAHFEENNKIVATLVISVVTNNGVFFLESRGSMSRQFFLCRDIISIEMNELCHEIISLCCDKVGYNLYF